MPYLMGKGEAVSCGMDDRPKRTRCLGKKTDRTELRKTKNRTGSTDHPFRSGTQHDIQDGGSLAGRSGNYEEPGKASREQ